MDSDAIKAATPEQLRERNVVLNQALHAARAGKPQGFTEHEAAREKKLLQSELRSRGERIRHSTRVSTDESKRKAQGITPNPTLVEALDENKALRAELAKLKGGK